MSQDAPSRRPRGGSRVSPLHVHCSCKPFTCYCNDTCIPEPAKVRATNPPAALRSRSRSRNRAAGKSAENVHAKSRRGNDIAGSATVRDPECTDSAHVLKKEKDTQELQLATLIREIVELRLGQEKSARGSISRKREEESIVTATQGLDEMSFSLPSEDKCTECEDGSKENAAGERTKDPIAYINYMYEKVVVGRVRGNT